MALFNDRRPVGGLRDVSDITKSTQDKTYARRRTLAAVKSRANIAPPQVQATRSANATSQRVVDAWKNKTA